MIKHKYLLTLSLLGLLVSLDQLTKFLASLYLRSGNSVEVISNFVNFTLVHNRGAAFGLLADAPESVREPMLLVLPFITLILVFVFLVRMPEHEAGSIVALGLIIGGACGNLIDRLRTGHVVDFLDLHWRNRHHFPAFNLADTAITIGVFILILSLFFDIQFQKKAE